MKARLLFVDDSRSSRMLSQAYAEALLGDDAECLHASSGPQALEMLNEGRFDVMLLDLTMPQMSGYEVLAEIQRRKVQVPVIVVSADMQPQTQGRVAALGALAFIEKPLRLESLQAVLAKLGVLHAG